MNPFDALHTLEILRLRKVGIIPIKLKSHANRCGAIRKEKARYLLFRFDDGGSKTQQNLGFDFYGPRTAAARLGISESFF
jgi:hypothetical protein